MLKGGLNSSATIAALAVMRILVRLVGVRSAVIPIIFLPSSAMQSVVLKLTTNDPYDLHELVYCRLCFVDCYLCAQYCPLLSLHSK